MIHFAHVPEPPDFEQEVRQKGKDWLAKNPDKTSPRNLWSPFRKHLAAGFQNLCGYSAMFEPIGTVDHYISCHQDRAKAYDWDNYRFASAWINSSKKADDRILDPFGVQDEWFEVELLTFSLVPQIEKIPTSEIEKVKQTQRKLNNEVIVRQRREWYRTYADG